jgi:Contractile injection system tube protein/LysM domain
VASHQIGYQQAQLEIEGEPPLPCWFNPEQYAVSKANEWHSVPVVGASLPAIQFGGGLSRELTLELLFDASDSAGKDVLGVTDQLFLMMEVAELAGGAGNAARPPTVTFSWGPTVSFKAVCRRLDVRYTLFRPDGTPIRAICALTLVQVEKADSRSGSGAPAAQNPTTRATARLGVHVVLDGDSLPSLAYTAYGDPTRWREIAEANAIDDPLVLARGQALTIPEARER